MTTLLTNVVLVLCVLAVAAAADHGDTSVDAAPSKCPSPNGTDIRLHAFNCAANDAIQLVTARILDAATNKTVYPVDVRKKLILELNAINKGVAYTDNRVKAVVKEYVKSWTTGKCEWITFPTLGFLDNIDGCDYAHNCPLQTGNLDLRLPLDLKPLAGLISLLSANPYQIEIRMHDYNSGSAHEEIACVVVQLHFAHK
ncbi:Protein C17F4.7 [Aphelenchoides avenae]|nr:Protein C17F4.7 [Aphelenchus avenae]